MEKKAKAKAEAKTKAKGQKPARKYSAPVVTRHGNIRMMVQMYSPS